MDGLCLDLGSINIHEKKFRSRKKTAKQIKRKDYLMRLKLQQIGRSQIKYPGLGERHHGLDGYSQTSGFGLIFVPREQRQSFPRQERVLENGIFVYWNSFSKYQRRLNSTQLVKINGFIAVAPCTCHSNGKKILKSFPSLILF